MNLCFMGWLIFFLSYVGFVGILGLFWFECILVGVVYLFWIWVCCFFVLLGVFMLLLVLLDVDNILL